MPKLLEIRSGRALYGYVPTWDDARIFMQAVLGLPVVRVAVAQFKAGDLSLTDSPVVVFEDAEGRELGCWTLGLDRLQVFDAPRLVHASLRSEKTLWDATSEAAATVTADVHEADAGVEKSTCKNCGESIRLRPSGVEWVHDDPDEDPSDEDYGWIGCVGEPTCAEPV